MSIESTAREFFEACETGKGWEGCKGYCHDSATFSAQADALADVTTLAGYADWMKGLLTPIPDGHYELKSFSADADRGVVTAFAVFHGTHSVDGPVPATGKKVAADYVYAMDRGSVLAHGEPMEVFENVKVIESYLSVRR